MSNDLTIRKPSVDQLARFLCEVDGRNPDAHEPGNYTIPYDADYIGDSNTACDGWDGPIGGHREPWVYFWRLYGEKAMRLLSALESSEVPNG